MARDILAVSIATTVLEFAFSVGGRIYTWWVQEKQTLATRLASKHDDEYDACIYGSTNRSRY